MKILCDKSTLQNAISTAQKAITGKSPMPSLMGILIKAYDNELTLIGSDIDLSIETKMKAEISQEGTILVDCKIFGDIIRKLPSNKILISTSDDNKYINIVCEKSMFSLVLLNFEDFPEIPRINENNIFTLPQTLLKNMIKSTIFAIAQDETRPIFTGVLFEVRDSKLNLAALDGFRLSLRSEEIDSDNTINAVIPGKTLNEVSKILDENEEKVYITFTPNHILFNINGTKVISRLLKGEFIKYASIIPSEYNLHVTIKRIELLDAIERASLVGKEGNANLIKIDITEDSMIITSNSSIGNVKEELNVILDGEGIEIAFNSKYLIDVLKTMDDDEIIMQFTTNVSPCILKNKNKDDCTYLVLPVRIMPTSYQV